MTEEHEGEGLSPEERLSWLRDHGIEVVTPEERKAGQITRALRDTSIVDNHDVAISYILIPADTSKPMEERNFPIGEQGLVLEDYLKPHFVTGGKGVDLDLLEQNAAQTLASSIGDRENPLTVTRESLAQVAQQASIETFDLVHATEANNHEAVKIYLDEVGMLKRLPLNSRATKLAEKAGYNPPPQFYGDVFLARVYETGRNGSIHRRPLPLALSEVSLDSPWLRDAAMHNLEYQAQMDRITGRTSQNIQQPAIAGTEGPKDEGCYSWTQTEEELEVKVELPLETNSKSIKVNFRANELQITCMDISLTLGLFERVDVDGCTWTLESNGTSKSLVATMEKQEPAYWPRIID